MSPTRFLTVRGVLLDPDGQPAANVNVSLQRPTSGLGVTVHKRSSAKADGTFEIRDVPPGEHAIVVNRYGAPGSQYAFVPLRVYDDIEGLTIRLQPGVTIKGQVLFEGIAPAPLPTMYVRSVSARYGSRSGAPSGVMPAPDLSFTLEHQFGPTLIRADPPPGWHLKSVLHDGRDVTDEPTEFGEAARVQVVLTQRAASLTGVVTTASGARLRDRSCCSVKTRRSGTNGRVRRRWCPRPETENTAWKACAPAATSSSRYPRKSRRRPA